MTRLPARLLALAAFAFALAPASGAVRDGDDPPAPKPAPKPDDKPDEKPKAAPLAVAVIVHADNALKGVTLDELRQLLRLDRQFWADQQKVVVVGRPAATPEQAVLLQRVYELDDKGLRKLFVAKLFAGRIAAIPTVVKTAAAAAKFVQQSPGAITVVLASDVPAGVKVLAIDGKRPGDAGYALVAAE